MSESYAPVPSNIFQRVNSARSLALYVALVSFCNSWDDGLCYPTEAKLAARAKVSVRTLRNALRELEDAELVSTSWRTYTSGMRSGINYQLHVYWSPGGLIDCSENGRCWHDVVPGQTVRNRIQARQILPVSAVEIARPTRQTSPDPPAESADRTRDSELETANKRQVNKVESGDSTDDAKGDLMSGLNRLVKAKAPDGVGEVMQSCRVLPAYSVSQRGAAA